MIFSMSSSILGHLVWKLFVDRLPNRSDGGKKEASQKDLQAGLQGSCSQSLQDSRVPIKRQDPGGRSFSARENGRLDLWRTASAEWSSSKAKVIGRAYGQSMARSKRMVSQRGAIRSWLGGDVGRATIVSL